jgi:hypothetical protein
MCVLKLRPQKYIQGAALSAQGTIDRTPGRLVVWALICLYGWFFFLILGETLGEAFLAMANLSALACPLLILAAVVMRVGAPE